MGVWGQRRWTTCDLYPVSSHRLVAVILAKSSSRSTRDGQTTPSISEKVWTHPKTDVPPGEVLSKHHLHVLINFPSPFLCWVQHGKANALSSLISPVKKLSSNFPPFWIWPKLLNAEKFPLRPLTLGLWPSSALPDTWAKAEAAKEKKYPGIRVLTVPFWAAESEWDESQKQGSGCPRHVSFCLTSWWAHQIAPRLAPSGRTSSVLWFTSGIGRPLGLGATVCDLGPFPATDLCWR